MNILTKKLLEYIHKNTNYHNKFARLKFTCFGKEVNNLICKEEIERDYIDAKKAGEILHLSPSRISRLCSAGRFKGAFKNGGSWLIPHKAVLEHTHLPPGPKPTRLTPEQTKEVISEALGQTKEGDTHDQQ